MVGTCWRSENGHLMEGKVREATERADLFLFGELLREVEAEGGASSDTLGLIRLFAFGGCHDHREREHVEMGAFRCNY
jgi:hypothetical protein